MKPKKETLNLSTKTILQCFRTNHLSINSSWHYYDEYELRVFGDIRGEAHIGSYAGSIEPFSVFLLAPNLPRSWKSQAPEFNIEEGCTDQSSFSVFFPEEAIERAKLLFPELICLSDMLKRSKAGLKFPSGIDTREVGRDIAALDGLKGCEKLCSFFMILDRLRESPFEMLSVDTREGQQQRCEPLDWALDFINNNYDRNIDLETVAGVACMSPSYFCRLFKSTFDTGLVDYINSLRIEKMCFLLARTSKSISTIALETGFSNLSNCNRTFKKRMNMSPSQYRKYYWKTKTPPTCATDSDQGTGRQVNIL